MTKSLTEIRDIFIKYVSTIDETTRMDENLRRQFYSAGFDAAVKHVTELERAKAHVLVNRLEVLIKENYANQHDKEALAAYQKSISEEGG